MRAWNSPASRPAELGQRSDHNIACLDPGWMVPHPLCSGERRSGMLKFGEDGPRNERAVVQTTKKIHFIDE
jgi:hypothetical protein